MVEHQGPKSKALDRRAVVKRLLADRGDLLLVAGLGAPAWDSFAAGDAPANFYLWGAMGGAAMIGLGLALAQPSRPVAVITGDGEALMGLGALASIAVQRPSNLSIIVLDNERYGETGMQKSHTADGVDLAAVAEACGFPLVRHIHDEAALDALARDITAGEGPLFAQIKVSAEDVTRALPPRDGAFLAQRFRQTVVGSID